MKEEASYSVSDLVLQVPLKVDPKAFDLDAYEPFIDALCKGRRFQEEALRASLLFLAGGEISSTSELARGEYERNPSLQAKYAAVDDLVAELPFPDKLACSIDLATGTGKSFVIYGLARVLLNEGTVDRVLVLCPSTTIERGLLEKFRALSADRDLRDALPRRKGGIANPDITQATSTIEAGQICVENIHATYTGTKSAIGDSLRGKGETTLVLNDEAHHIYSPTDRHLKKWMTFLSDEGFGFRRIVGFSGTCYRGNEYFSDVIYRYALPTAIEDGTVKRVWYVDEDASKTENEAFQKILANHERNRRRYKPLKPLTILVTKDIKAAKELSGRLAKFLRKNSKRKGSADNVLTVTSAKEHQSNVAVLSQVDLKGNKVEWIVSVSMLTEGWDVKNVFQIVPHEQRAFNSKLLIAQVLGRGLRVPESLAGTKPEVTVFNHQGWAKAIRGLVDEVMELDVRLSAYPISERKDFNFVIDQIIYKVTQKTEKVSERRGPVSLPKSIALAPQSRRAARRTGYKSIAGDGATREIETDIRYPVRPVTEVAERVRNKLKAIDVEQGTTYAKKATVKHLEDVITKSLVAAGSKDSYVSEENEQTILQAFGPLVRRATRQRPRLTVEVDKIVSINTSEMPARSIAVTALRKDAGLSYDEASLREGKEQDLKRLAEIDEGHPYGSTAVQLIPNTYNFKTPTNIVLTSHRPERLFVKELMRAQNAKAIDGWVKSPDSGFYGIEYTYRKGEHQKQSSFNPDFFISVKKGKEVLVVETKMDGDDSAENKGKLKYAELHFDLLNKKQKARRYHFYFLSPKDYDLFFQALRDKKHAEFQSELHTLLKRNGNGTPAKRKPPSRRNAKTGSK